MERLATVILFLWSITVLGQSVPTAQQRKDIIQLIDTYSRARETRDTILLKTILTSDIDQLVSTGEWREGLASATKGMQRSTASNPGTRSLTVEKIRLITFTSAIVDCNYVITSENGSLRKMWSTFVVVQDKSKWRIAAIRNMLPAAQ